MTEASLWIIIPAYNEGEAIASTLDRLSAYWGKVVVVDDCSHHETFINAKQWGRGHVLRHPINLGQGAALQTGIEYAPARGAEYICTFDADGQHNPREIQPMLIALRQSGAEVALGSRFLGDVVGMTEGRKRLLKLAVAFTRFTCGLKLSDAHNGFRLLTQGFCRKFIFNQNRMAHASEILNYISTHTIPYIEFPVTITYSPYSRQKGQKSSESLKIILELLLGFISK